ncbi:nose resistant to fluoxetine protein 6-like [Diachasmimorpha longicaudata]|uniref:nose resistant to fluoxetine protein 6-like n=1 Tax=Diachasmimorpha longicaudata TaxID=58733 RepID=UPI0030B8F0DF
MYSRVAVQLPLFFALKILVFGSIAGQVRPSNGSDNVTSVINNIINWNSVINNSPSAVIDLIREFQPDRVIQKYVQTSLGQDIPRDVENSTCDAQLQIFVSGLLNFETWALKMFDSSSKIPSGILFGNNQDLGVYDECLSIEIAKETELIRGRHCMYLLSVTSPSWPMPVFTTLSICVPSACDAQHLMTILQNASDAASDQLPFAITTGRVTCSAVDPPPFEVGEILTITFFAIFICFLIGCTFCDFLVRTTLSVDRDNIINEFCRFSLYTNLKRILSTKKTDGNIAVIPGLRFFSMCWVILGHEYALKMLSPTINMGDIPSWLQSWGSIYIAIAPFAVDTFFTLSGFLTSYLFLKELAKGRKFNPVMYYLHRYIRLTPAFLALILLTIYIFPRWGSGALWETLIDGQQKTCKENWWPMLLYVHNYVSTGILGCLTHTWYLAVDMQYFWISPLILYPLGKKPKIGLAILVALIVASIICPAVIAAEDKYSGALAPSFVDVEHIESMMKEFYIVSHTRAGPWLLGVLLGFILSKHRHFRFSLMRVGWISAVLAFAFIFFTYRIFQQDGYKWKAPWEIFYTAVARHIWAFGVCWIVYASVLGYAGIVGKILSLPIFMPFGRISYSVYLIHFMIQMMRVGATRTPLYFTDGGIIYSFLGQYIVCTLGGLLLSLIFESPFVALEKIIFGGKRRPKQQESSKGIHNGGYKGDNS